LQEHGVVEGSSSGELTECSSLGDGLHVFDPLVAVADLEEQTEPERVLDPLVHLALGLLADQRAFGDQSVHELHLGQLVVSVDGVLGGRLQPESLQLLLEALVLTLGQVLVELGGVWSVAGGHLVLELGGGGGVLVHAPGAGTQRPALVEAQA